MASEKQFSPTTPTHVDKASSGDATPAPSCFCGSSHVHGKGQYAVAREDGAAIDPVCGMSVTIATAKHTCEHGGTTYYFCKLRCKEKFAAESQRYLEEELNRAAAAKEAAAAPAGTMWTCPMDPEIVQDHPGACPICGMALEPMGVPTADTGPNPGLVDSIRRLMECRHLATQ